MSKPRKTILIVAAGLALAFPAAAQEPSPPPPPAKVPQPPQAAQPAKPPKPLPPPVWEGPRGKAPEGLGPMGLSPLGFSPLLPAPVGLPPVALEPLDFPPLPPVGALPPGDLFFPQQQSAAERERQRAEEAKERERQRAEEAKERERQRAEEAKERAEEARQRAEEGRDRERERRERLNEWYEEGREAIDEGRMDRAVALFDRVIDGKGDRADGAMYWKAYALHKQGRRQEALGVLQNMTSAYPQSRWLKDAKALEMEVRQSTGQMTKPEDESDCELKLYAINSLMNRASDDAVPALEKFLSGTKCPKAKSQALFVLSQSKSPRARQVIEQIARGDSNPDLQRAAIRNIALHSSAENRTMLAEVYKTSNDVSIKRQIINGFMVSGDRERLFAVARTESNPELRGFAINQLGVMGAETELWEMYKAETSADVKKRIVNALFVGGKVDRLLEVARTDKDIEIRKSAINGLGISGKRTGPELVKIYEADKDSAIRRQVLNSLFLQQNVTSLIDIARKETDVDLKKRAVNYLAQIGSPEATKFLMEILNN